MHYKHTGDCKNTAYSLYMFQAELQQNLTRIGASSFHSILAFITHFTKTFKTDSTAWTQILRA